MLLRGRHFETGTLTDLRLEGDRIVAATPADPALSPDLLVDWLSPPLCDIQINGALGRSFTSPQLSLAEIRDVVAHCARHGIGPLLPTVVTSAPATLRHAFRTLAEAVATAPDLAAALPGFHLEGPYIAAADGPRGAHPREHVRLPDEAEFQELQRLAAGRIRLVTLAPELPGALEFIRRRAAEGVVVALGHSAATPAEVQAAVAAGARLSTHLGNGAPRELPRHPNLLWEQLGCDELWASVIADDRHLPEAVLRCVVRCKTPRRLVLTCDVSPWGGMPPGVYGQWDQQVEVRAEGTVVLVGSGLLAGSWCFTDACIDALARLGELGTPDLLALAVTRPRELLGLPLPRLEAGAPADLLGFCATQAGGLALTAVFHAGQRLVGP
ncbi:MAG TPA: N-acetylglucosamine-6-phosphate deacetylase [Gemmatales bacterium]|nr:N-acetylglucosamine-6-phosphate deacetylase [Gemmatales bacterium]HMP61269.1 N-acetylglucosamine-6-phosphate deacetylase [Gemmatales bacterium]